MNKLNGQSKDVLEENVSKIKELFPEAFEEGKIDFDVLKKLLGNFVDKDTERYSFSWNGKSKAIKTALTPTSSTLRPDRESSKNWDSTENIFIEGDNLEVLKVLQDTYRNKVKMIYIDPPYNTGHDFVYSDNFNDTVADYKERTNQAMVSNADTNGRYHTNWLNMMYPRLRLARNLLLDDGVIFISIDDNEVTNLRKICDEVFGESSFLGNITWINRTKPKNIGGAKYSLQQNTEYVLVYSKQSKDYFTGFVLPETAKKLYPYKDEKNNKEYRTEEIQQRKNLGSMRRDSMVYNLLDIDPKENYRWQLSPGRKDLLLKENKLIKTGQRIYEILYREDEEGSAFDPFWSHRQDTGTAENAKEFLESLLGKDDIFDTVKPIDLLVQLLRFLPNDCLVLDFFAGSGTTAHAVMDLNAEDEGKRKFITVQLPEETNKESEAYKAGYKYISDISKERIRRAGEKIKADNNDKEGIDKLDIGFKAFTLDSTNLTLWDEKTQDLQTSLLEQINSTKNGRTQEDVLYEVLLKYGVDLATPIAEESINGKKVYSIAGGYLLVCLDKDIDLETVSEIAKKKPERVVFYDHGFKDDMVKINSEQTLKKAGIEDIRVI